MNPITPSKAIGGYEVVYAKNQPDYIPLPVRKWAHGRVVSCWQMSLKERLKALWTGKVFLSQLTFNTPLQPVLIQVYEPRYLSELPPPADVLPMIHSEVLDPTELIKAEA